MAKRKKVRSKQKSDQVPVNVKMSVKERAAMRANAKKFTGNNVSEWVRLSTNNHVPSKKELADLRA